MNHGNRAWYCMAVLSLWIILYTSLSSLYIKIPTRTQNMKKVQPRVNTKVVQSRLVVSKAEFNTDSVDIDVEIPGEKYDDLKMIKEVIEKYTMTKMIKVGMNENASHKLQRRYFKEQTKQIYRKDSKNKPPSRAISKRSQDKNRRKHFNETLSKVERTVSDLKVDKPDSIANITSENMIRISSEKAQARMNDKAIKEAKSNKTKAVSTNGKPVPKRKIRYVKRVVRVSGRKSYYEHPKTTVISPINATFLITSEHVCKDVNPDLIMLVPSSPNYIFRRNAIRKTYGTLSRDRKSSINGENVKFIIRVIFLIGMSADSPVMDSVFTENKKFNDIVLPNFTDIYQDLTRKVLYGLQWVTQYCSKATYVMKNDDDVFVNTAILSQRLQAQPHRKQGSIFGHIYKGYRTVQRTGKWALSYAEFPSQSFPDYMSGTSYVISADLVPKILYIAQRLHLFRIEDVFITGIIANRILGASLIGWADNSFWNYRIPEPCLFYKGQLSMTNATPRLIYDAWNTLIANGTKPDGTKCA